MIAINKLANVRTAQRCVEEWLVHLAYLDPQDVRFEPAHRAYREAIAFRNRLENGLLLAEAD